MKLMAVLDVASGRPPLAVRAELVGDLNGSWEGFASAALREAYASGTPTRVVFILEADDRAAAELLLKSLPQAGRPPFRAQLVELKPSADWSFLFPNTLLRGRSRPHLRLV